MSHDFYITPEEYDIAKRNGLPKYLVYQRVMVYGWDIERAITQPKKEQKSYGTLVRIAKQNGIKPNTFYSRIHLRGMTPEEAAVAPLQSFEEKQRAASIVAAKRKQKHPEWVYKLAKENGISLKRLNYRIRKGWDMKEAATVPVIKDMRARRDCRRGRRYGY